MFNLGPAACWWFIQFSNVKRSEDFINCKPINAIIGWREDSVSHCVNLTDGHAREQSFKFHFLWKQVVVMWFVCHCPDWWLCVNTGSWSCHRNNSYHCFTFTRRTDRSYLCLCTCVLWRSNGVMQPVITQHVSLKHAAYISLSGFDTIYSWSSCFPIRTDNKI